MLSKGKSNICHFGWIARSVVLVMSMLLPQCRLLAALPPAEGPDIIEDEKNIKVNELQELIVKPKRQKYSKKNNPAVNLMRQVREDRKRTNPEKQAWYSYDKYDKIVVGINNFNVDLEKKEGAIGKKIRFFSQYVDTAAWTGKQILNISVKEKLSKIISGNNRRGKVEIVDGLSSHGLDEAFNQENVRKVVEDIVREIDIYSNDIILLQNRFVSPLSQISADYYKFEITDTVDMNGVKCVELTFSPHTPESMGFNGKLYIGVKDSVKYVRRATMRLPKAANVNYIDNLFISQNYEIDSSGISHKTLDDVCIEFKVLPGTPEIYGNRFTVYSGFSDKQTKSHDMYASYKGSEKVVEGAETRNKDYWNDRRPYPLSTAQAAMGSMMKNFRKVPLLFWAEKVLSVFVKGYIQTGNPSKFDIGPVNTTISYNKAEGVRLRVGGMTTCALSPRLFGRAYAAYGTHDHKWKYLGEVEYSFIDKKYTSREFPVNSIRATYSYDTDQLGQHYLFTNPDNMFLSLKRKQSDLITYRRLGKIEYNLELLNNLSFGIELRNEIQESTPWVPFKTGYGADVDKFTQSVMKFMIRYAPGEKFVQGKTVRVAVNMDAPVFLLTHEYGPKGFMGSDFTLNKTELSIQKRFWFSAFGYTDIILKGGILWSKVQFPALLWQNANLSYTIQPESYSLMNPMEFAMDKFASVDFAYNMNGLIFNRIPFVKKLKLREVFTFKGFYGGLSKKNNPEYNSDLFRFPQDAGTVPMGKKPYMEIGAGLDNILTILRVDYVWRLTYRDRPGIDRHGLRISLRFSF